MLRRPIGEDKLLYLLTSVNNLRTYLSVNLLSEKDGVNIINL